MKKIRIISIPEGSAPEEIRKQWVDLEIPLSENSFHKVKNSKSIDYSVDGEDAIKALIRAGKTKAADFWGPHKTGHINFPQKDCMVISY